MVAITLSPGQAVPGPQPQGRTPKTPLGGVHSLDATFCPQQTFETKPVLSPLVSRVPLVPEIRKVALCLGDTDGLDSCPHVCSIRVQTLGLPGLESLCIVGSSWVAADPRTHLFAPLSLAVSACR